MNFKCFFGFHEYEIIKENGKEKKISVIDENNPFSIIGQYSVCWMRGCINCGKAQVSWLRNGIPHMGWHNITAYLNEKEITKGFAECDFFIDDGTPVVDSLSD